jgi:hypothetical protein
MHVSEYIRQITQPKAGENDHHNHIAERETGFSRDWRPADSSILLYIEH